MSIELRHLSFGYAAKGPQVLDDVTAIARAGRVTAVLGPNGAGKSTLLRIILGELHASGTVTFTPAVSGAGEAPVARMSPAQRARTVAYVPQRGSEAFGMTVRSVVELGAWAGGQPAAAADRAMADAAVAEFADRPLRTLSAGQQQRVLLARALAQLGGQAGPDLAGKVLLADEPGSAMDLRWVDVSLGRLRAVAGAGATVIVVVHDLTLAERFADDCWLLDGGRLVASGPTAEVLTDERVSEVWGVAMRAAAIDGRRVWVPRAEPGADG